jgi:membrane-bound serine protease (ClpP class)
MREGLGENQHIRGLASVRRWGETPSVFKLCSTLLAAFLGFLSFDLINAEEPTLEKPAPATVVVIPVREQITSPELYILRRGLKEAIAQEVDTIVLDMDTPGGALKVTFEMLLALEKFPGKTITYVNREAISAGALIAAGTDEIHFAPGGIIGAAAPVLATGGELDETMRAKIISYLKARVRAITEGKDYRGEVISAMIDMDYEFKIGDEVIKPKGELLSLTATEAMKMYGDPPRPLLGAGIAADLTELLDGVHGVGNYTIVRLEITWSERVAQYLTTLTPILLALGMLGLFVEFKTPGFGIFGAAGIFLLGAVFFGQYAAGLSGHEPMLIFALGLALVVIDLFFFPGTFVLALAGLTMMLGSLIWAMADLWPNEPIEISTEVFLRPLINVVSGVGLALVIFIGMLKFLPRGGLWGGMVLEAAVGGEPGSYGMAGGTTSSLIGQRGIAVTPLFPSGQVEISGRRYEASLAVGSAEADVPVIVTGQGEFGLMVEVLS